MACRLCRRRTDDMSGVVSLKDVDESKLQSWACQNVGNRINLDDGGAPALVCWPCVHSARKLARCFGSAGQDWWTGFEDPNGTPEDDFDESDEELEDVSLQNDEDEFVLRPCFVRIRRLSAREVKENVSTDDKCSRIAVEEEDGEVLKNPVHESGPMLFQCTICSKSFPLRLGLKRHLLYMHPFDLLSCKYCPLANFENRQLLQIHCNYYHKEELEVAQLKLTCNYCNQLMGSNVQLKFHMNLQHPNLRFQCTNCGEWFPTLLSQRLHFRREHLK